MKRKFVIAALAGLLGLVAPLATLADDASNEMAEMRTMVEQLKGQVEAQAEQLEHQGNLLREAQHRVALHEEEDAKSGLAPFLSSLEVDGWVAGSYFWNYNNPGSGQVGNYTGNGLANQGASGLFYPFHGSYNNFNLDQVWFGIGKPASEESRAGFRFDLVYGTTACTLGGSFGLRCPGDNTSQMYVNQAYVEYLAPIGRGVTFKFGKFGTLIGAEVAQTVDNFNITRGNVYNLLQPIDHMGVLASTDLGAGFSAAIGGLNGNFTDDPDINLAKSLVAQLAWAYETFSVGATVLWGGEQGPINPVTGTSGKTNGNASGIFDLLLKWDPTESLSTWIDFDYDWTKGIQFGTAGGKASGWGLAVAGRYGITEAAGVSLRFEYAEDNKNFFGFTDAFTGTPTDARIFGLTGTVDYALLEHLMLRGEVRWDTIKKFQATSNREFFDRGNTFASNQVTTGVEVIYTF